MCYCMQRQLGSGSGVLDFSEEYCVPKQAEVPPLDNHQLFITLAFIDPTYLYSNFTVL